MIQCAPQLFQSDHTGSRLPPSRPRIGPELQGVPLDAPVLIVEDEVLIAWTLHDMLAEMGFTDVQIARDAREAVARAADRRPRLLICDVNLGSGDDGIAAAASICSSERVPVLFISGYAGDEIRERIEVSMAGAPLLRKPIQPSPLARCLMQLFGKPTPH